MHITHIVFTWSARHASSIAASLASASLVWGVQSLSIFQHAGLDLVWPFYVVAIALQTLSVTEYFANR